jgi:hypothetical protein
MDLDFHLKVFSIDRRISISRKRIQVAIVLAVLMISTAAAYWGSGLVLLGLAGGAIGIAGFLILLRVPNLWFILLLLAGMFVPFAGPGGFNAAVLIVILMISLWLLDMLVVKRRFTFVKSRPIRPAMYMLLVSVLAFALGQIPWFVFSNQAPLNTQLGGFVIYFFLVATTIFTGNVLQDVEWLKRIVWVFIGLGTFYMLGRAAHLALIDRIYQHGVAANSMFWTWLVTLSVSQAMHNSRLSPRIRALLYGVAALTLFVAFVQAKDWNSGWLPAVIVIAILVVLKVRKWAPIILPFVPIILPIVVMVVIYLAQSRLSTDSYEQYSWGTRLDAWSIVLQISQVSPIIGMGFANYYWYARLFPIRGYFVRFNSHSQYVDIIAQTGILGLICFLWMLIEIVLLARKLGGELPDGFEKAYSYGVLAGVFGCIMAGFLVDWVLPFAYNIGLDGVRGSILPWIFFGGLIAIEQAHLAKQREDLPAPGARARVA